MGNGSDSDLRGNRWAVLGIIMMGTFMAILDSSIVNVALPHMMSTFGVDRDKIEWVATGFMLTSAVVMPLVGWLTSRISYKALYLGSLAIFTVASLLCALAWSYESLIAAATRRLGALHPMTVMARLDLCRARGAAGSYSNVACLNPRGARRWFELMESDPARALEWEGRIQAFFKAHMVQIALHQRSAWRRGRRACACLIRVHHAVAVQRA